MLTCSKVKQNHCSVSTHLHIDLGGGVEGHRDRDRMVVIFATTYAISAYSHHSCEFEPCSWRGVLDITLCDKGHQLLVTGRSFSPGTLVSSFMLQIIYTTVFRDTR